MIKKLSNLILIGFAIFLNSCTNGGGVATNISPAVVKVTKDKSVSAELNQSTTTTVIFSAPTGIVFTGFSVTNLSALPSGWSSTVNSLVCSLVTSGNSCFLQLTFSPTSTQQRGTLTLNYTYINNLSQRVTGSTNIPYFISSSTNYVPTTQFGVYNNCPYKVWFQSIDKSGLNAPVQGLNPGESYDYQINGQFIDSFRVWPKTGCDESGNNCTLGQSSSPCGVGGCAPPVDSKFEGTFNAPGNSGVTSYDGSLVDGFTLPFSIRVTKAATESNPSCLNVDASNISYATSCPTGENVSTPANQMTSFGSYAFGPYNTFNGADLTSVSLSVINPNNQQISGCFAPTTKLTYPTWGGLGVGANESNYNVSYYNQTIMYSCAFTTSQLLNGTAPGLPAAPNNMGFNNLSQFCNNTSGYCSASNPNGPAAHDICNLGPVVNTKYVQYVHANTKNLYAFAFDDGNGNLSCNLNQTKLAFITCP